MRRRARRGFSLLEVVVVVVIVGVIAAIAVPRVGHVAERANQAALLHNMTLLQKAIDLYTAEHEAPPTADDLVLQLTGYTDADGNTSPVKSTVFIYGPYLKSIPPALQKGADAAPADPDDNDASPGFVDVVDPVTKESLDWTYNEGVGVVAAPKGVRLVR